jgi:muramoyltetrapeptide carboxypeptidase
VIPQRIYVYSPSSAVRDKAAVRRGIARLQALGHEVEADPAAFATHMRFAGDDDTRLAAIGRAAASGADIAIITRGGYGLTRLLPRLPFKALAKAVAGGTKFVGLSDFTALQCSVLAEQGAVTWAGPAVGEDFGVEGEPDEIMLACFEDLVTGQGEGAGWRLPPAERVQPPLELQGTLWGGNLSLLSALVGTPWLPRIRGGILFLEDVHEHPYRVERMLAQLLHAGVLGRQKAVVLGHFNNYQPAPHDKGFRLKTVVEWLRSQIQAPVLTGLPFGHVATKVLLPVGMKVHLAVEGRDAFLLWGHRH